MRWHEDCGTPLWSYCGHGALACPSRPRTQVVYFEVAQLPTTHIYVECESEDDFAWIEAGEPLFIRGVTDYGATIAIDRIAIVGTSVNDTRGTALLLATVLGEVRVVASPGSVPLAGERARFVLFNARIPELKQGAIALETEAYALHLERLANHDEAIRAIRASATNRVTAAATLTLADGKVDERAALSIIQRLCLLLSLAQGYRVGWAYCELIRDGKSVLWSHRQEEATSPAFRPQLIPQHMPDEIDAFERFLRHALELYEEKERQWRITALLSANVDAAVAESLDARVRAYALIFDTARSAYRQSEPQAMGGASPGAALAATARLLTQGRQLADRFHGVDRSARDALAQQMMRLAHQLLLGLLEYEGSYFDWHRDARGAWVKRKQELAQLADRPPAPQSRHPRKGAPGSKGPKPRAYSAEEIIAILREAEKGAQSIATLCRAHGIAGSTFYRWRRAYGEESTESPP
jgi:hypothetical protein